MSIYATHLCLDGDDEHESLCAAYRESEIEGCQERTDEPCNCSERLNAPIVYQGSHVSPSDDDPRGGFVMLCAIPNHCHPDVRDATTKAIQQMHAEGWDEIEPMGSMAAVRWSGRVDDVLGPIEKRESKHVDFLRLSVREGRGTDSGCCRDHAGHGDATVILDRHHVEELHETLTLWLNSKERA